MRAPVVRAYQFINTNFLNYYATKSGVKKWFGLGDCPALQPSVHRQLPGSHFSIRNNKPPSLVCDWQSTAVFQTHRIKSNLQEFCIWTHFFTQNLRLIQSWARMQSWNIFGLHTNSVTWPLKNEGFNFSCSYRRTTLEKGSQWEERRKTIVSDEGFLKGAM